MYQCDRFQVVLILVGREGRTNSSELFQVVISTVTEETFLASFLMEIVEADSAAILAASLAAILVVSLAAILVVSLAAILAAILAATGMDLTIHLGYIH